MKKIEAITRKTLFEQIKGVLLVADIEWFSYYRTEQLIRGVGKNRKGRIYQYIVYDTSFIERILRLIVFNAIMSINYLK